MSVFLFNVQNKNVALNPEDEIFIACSPRVVRRRLGSANNSDSNAGSLNINSPDQLMLPSPGIVIFHRKHNNPLTLLILALNIIN